jgi:hypothetical protein
VKKTDLASNDGKVFLSAGDPGGDRVGIDGCVYFATMRASSLLLVHNQNPFGLGPGTRLEYQQPVQLHLGRVVLFAALAVRHDPAIPKLRQDRLSALLAHHLFRGFTTDQAEVRFRVETSGSAQTASLPWLHHKAEMSMWQ